MTPPSSANLLRAWACMKSFILRVDGSDVALVGIETDVTATSAEAFFGVVAVG